MKPLLLAVLFVVAHAQAPQPTTLPDGVTTRDVKFFSEGVQCFGHVFVPRGVTADGRAPAVVLAPGWGRSGGFLYLAAPVRWDDRLRFSQHTAKMRIRRKRLVPEAQVLDIRNAISFLQGEPGVDRARIGVWGADMAGGHVVVVAATDARIKAAVAQTLLIEGRDAARKAFAPTAEQQAAMVKLARSGEAPATPLAAAAMNDEEAKLALADYHPFWYADAIPPAAAVLFILAEKDLKVDNDANAVAAAKLLKGPNGVTVVPGAGHTLATAQAFDAAVDAAASWFQKYL
jgi:uncharacterized protein